MMTPTDHLVWDLPESLGDSDSDESTGLPYVAPSAGYFGLRRDVVGSDVPYMKWKPRLGSDNLDGIVFLVTDESASSSTETHREKRMTRPTDKLPENVGTSSSDETIPYEPDLSTLRGAQDISKYYQELRTEKAGMSSSHGAPVYERDLDTLGGTEEVQRSNYYQDVPPEMIGTTWSDEMPLHDLTCLSTCSKGAYPTVKDQALDEQVEREQESMVGHSLGSAQLAHQQGTCKVCIFAHKKSGCNLGDQCTFCHFPHTKRYRPRPSKLERIQCRRIANLLNTVFDEDSHQFQRAVKMLSDESEYMNSVFKSVQGKSDSHSSVQHPTPPTSAASGGRVGAASLSIVYQ